MKKRLFREFRERAEDPHGGGLWVVGRSVLGFRFEPEDSVLFNRSPATRNRLGLGPSRPEFPKFLEAPKKTTLAVPLLVALILASSTACTEKTAPPVVRKSALADSADQVMYGAHFNLTDKGLSRAELLSDTAFFFDDNTRIELRKVETTFYTTSGARDAYLTSNRGTYNNRTGLMIARGDVVVTTEEGRRLTTPELRYDQAMNEIASDSAFVLTEPGRRLEGIGFRSDPNMQNVQILKTKSGNTGAVTLPGQ